MTTKIQKNKKQYIIEERDWYPKKPKLTPYKKDKRKIDKNSIDRFMDE